MRSTLMLGLALLVGCTGGADGAEGPALIVGPAGANTFDDLLVQVDDDKPERYTYSWEVDGEPVDDLTDMTVPADRTRKGEEWTVTVTRGNRSSSATIEIGNALPSADVSISPASPTANEAITATGVATDPDNDPAFVEYRWLRFDPDPEVQDFVASTFTNRTLPVEATRRGQLWRIEVTPIDGDDQGNVGYLDFQVRNALPVVDSLRLSAARVSTNDRLRVTATAQDADGDALTMDYQWVLNGVEVATATTASYDGASPEGFDAGDEVYVKVRGNDGEPGPWRTSPVVQVVNGPPSRPTASILPEVAFEDDDLKCVLGDGAVDPDPGDTVTYRVEWTVNGAPFTGGGTVDIPNDTVPAALTQSQDTWTCRLVASDALGNESTATDEAFVDARSGCADGTTDADWNLDTEGCLHTEQITWAEARDNVGSYCAAGWEMAGSYVVNSLLNGPGYTDDWNFAFDGEGCGGVDHYATTNDSLFRGDSSCVWRRSHHTRLSSEESLVDGVMCVRAAEEEEE